MSTMRREVADLRTRFSVVGMDGVQAAFQATGAALRNVQRATTDYSASANKAAGDATKMLDAARAATAEARKGVADAKVGGVAQVDAVKSSADARLAAAKASLAAAKAAEKSARHDEKTARPSGDDFIFPVRMEAAVADHKIAEAAFAQARAATLSAQAQLTAARKDGATAFRNASKQAEEAVSAAKVNAAEKAKAEEAAARRVERAWQDAARSQIEDAKAAAKVVENDAKAKTSAEERAARAAEVASKASAARVAAIRKGFATVGNSLPKLGIGTALAGGLMPGVGLWKDLSERGVLPVLGSALAKVGSIAGSALGFVTRGLLAVTSEAGHAALAMGGFTARTGAGLATLTLRTVESGAALAYHLGTGAVSKLVALASAATRTATAVASIGAKTGLVAGGLTAAAVGGFGGLANKAVSGAADYAQGTFQASLSSGLDPRTFQALEKAAGGFGIELQDLRSGLGQFQTQAKAAVANPDGDVGKYFTRLGISATDAQGHIKNTRDLLLTVVTAANRLGDTEREDFLGKLFGQDAVGKLQPLFDALTSNNSLLAESAARLDQLGATLTPQDVALANQYKDAVGDLSSAWSGVQLAISRAIGPDVIAGFKAFAEFLAANRLVIASYFRFAYNVAQSFARDFVKIWTYGAGADAWLENKWLGPVRAGARWIYDTFSGLAHDVGILWTAGTGPGIEPYLQNRWLAPVARVTKSIYDWTAGLVRDLGLLWTYGTGIDRQLDNKWLVPVINTVARMIEIARTGGRLFGEALSAIRGDTGGVVEFPWLLTIRTDVLDAIQFVRQLGEEIRFASLGEAYQVPIKRFPWIWALADQVREVVAYVKATWADLVNVWSGAGAETTLGAWLAWAMGAFDKAKTYIADFVVWVGKVWDDLTKIWNRDLGGNFNFAFLKKVGDDIYFVADAAKKGWEAFKQFYDSLYDFFKLFGVDLEAVIFFAAFATFTGTARVILPIIGALVSPFGKILGALTGMAGVLGGGGAAGAAAAGGGLVGRFAALGTAVETGGAAALAAVSSWEALGAAITAAGSGLAALATTPAAVIGGGVLGGIGLAKAAQGTVVQKAFDSLTDTIYGFSDTMNAYGKYADASFLASGIKPGSRPAVPGIPTTPLYDPANPTRAIPIDSYDPRVNVGIGEHQTIADRMASEAATATAATREAAFTAARAAATVNVVAPPPSPIPSAANAVPIVFEIGDVALEGSMTPDQIAAARVARRQRNGG